MSQNLGFATWLNTPTTVTKAADQMMPGTEFIRLRKSTDAYTRTNQSTSPSTPHPNLSLCLGKPRAARMWSTCPRSPGRRTPTKRLVLLPCRPGAALPDVLRTGGHERPPGTTAAGQGGSGVQGRSTRGSRAGGRTLGFTLSAVGAHRRVCSRTGTRLTEA